MATPERRHAPRGKTQLLTAFRTITNGNVTSTGFGRALNLSVIGALVESPDPFPVGQVLSLEFLMDNDKIATVEGRVTRITQANKLYQVAVEFAKPPARARRLIELQAGIKPAKKVVKKPAKKSKPAARAKPKRKMKK